MSKLKDFKTSDLIQELAIRIGKNNGNRTYSYDNGDLVMHIPYTAKYKEVMEDTPKRTTTLFFNFDFLLELKVKKEEQ